ncbi:MAG TPA: hypothetical protein VMS30_01085 [Phycisphaerales bacterium]|nr:hypothetical protein [Phycisphaerales bacterium]
MNSMWTLVRTVCLVLVCAVVAMSAGCGKDASTDANGAGDGLTDMAADATDASNVVSAEDMPESAFNQMKDMWATQIAGPVAKADTLKQAAAEHKDARLNDLVAQLDKKAAEIKAMYDGAKYPSGAKTLQVDLPKAMGEAGELAAQAMERLQEVIKASLPAQPGGG